MHFENVADVISISCDYNEKVGLVEKLSFLFSKLFRILIYHF
jgi:hypothetical protein